MTIKEAREHGWVVVRGSYRNTPYDRMGFWYIEPIEGPCDRRGNGYLTRKDALKDIEFHIQTGSWL